MLVEVTIFEHRKKKVTIDVDFDFEAIAKVDAKLARGELNLNDAEITGRYLEAKEISED
jgi:hypothetical protein